MDILELNKRLQKLDLEMLKEKAVRAESKSIIQFNTDQLRHGLTAFNTPLLPKYSKDWAVYKSSLSSYIAPVGIADLFLTGNFHKGFYLIVDNGEYFINSTDEKKNDLQQKYNGIFGLNRDSQNALKPIVTAKLGELIKKELGL